MKFNFTKLFYSLNLLFAFGTLPAIAQTGRIVFSEDFNSGKPDWALVNDNNTPSNFIFKDAWIKFPDDERGDSCAASTSLFTSRASANRWMIFGPIGIEEQAVLSWDAQALNFQYPDGYAVYISDAGSGSPVTSGTPYLRISEENDFWTRRHIDLAPLGFKNQNIMIAFRHNSFDKDILLIDNIMVTDTTPRTRDLEIVGDSTLADFLTAIPFGGNSFRSSSFVIRNSGNQAMSGRLIVEYVDERDNVIQTEYLETPTILPGETYRTPDARFSPNDTNTYRVRARLEADDDRNSNNSYERYLLELKNRYSSATSFKVSPFKVDYSEPGKVGTVYRFQTDDTLKFIDYFVDNSSGKYTGAMIYAGVYGKDDAGNFSVQKKLMDTDTVSVPDKFKGKLRFELREPLFVEADTQVLVSVERDPYEDFEFSRDAGKPEENGSNNYVSYGSVTNNEFMPTGNLKVRGNFGVEAVTVERPCILEVEIESSDPERFIFTGNPKPDSLASGLVEIINVKNGTPPYTGTYIKSLDGIKTNIAVPGGRISFGETNATGWVVLTITDANGCIFSQTYSEAFVTTYMENTSGLFNLNSESVRFWPNPAYTYLHFSAPFEYAQAEIFTLSGERIVSRLLKNKEALSIESLASGMYFGVFRTNDSVGQFRFIKN